MARKIVLKENGLAGSGNTPSGYKYLGDSSGDISEKIGATISAIGGRPYKVYTALLTQTASNAPFANVLEDTIGNVSFEYNGLGQYKIYATGSLTTNKTYITISEQHSLTVTPKVVFDMGTLDNNKVEFFTYYISFNTPAEGDPIFVLSNNVLYLAPIEIRVYN
jgi:hypothetical protein